MFETVLITKTVLIIERKQ